MLNDTTTILGVRVSSINMEMALTTIESWLIEGRAEYVCVTGVHGIMESQYDPVLKGIHNRAGLVTPDGMPLVWINWLRGRGSVKRVYGPDLMFAVCNSEKFKQSRHFLYGSTPDTLRRLKDTMLGWHPEMTIVGCHSPPFRALTAGEVNSCALMINEARPDLVWVGLSTPKQEVWMDCFRPLLSAPVLLGVGAAFDFHAGTLKQAPRWIQTSGLEWLFRVWQEPRRLWKRYLRNNPLFCAFLLLEAIGLGRPSLSKPENELKR